MDNTTIFTTALIVGFSGAIMPGPLLTVTVMQTAVKGFSAGLLIVLGHAILEALLIVILVSGLASFLMLASVKALIAMVGGVFLIYLGIGMARSAYLGSVTDGNPAFQENKSLISQDDVKTGEKAKFDEDDHSEQVTEKSFDKMKILETFGGEGIPGSCSEMKVTGFCSEMKVLGASNETEVPRAYNEMKIPGASMHPVVAGILVSLSNPFWTIWWATLGLGYITLALENGKTGLLSFYSGHILADLSWYALVSATVVGGKGFLTPSIYRGIIMVCGLFLLCLGVYFIHSGISGQITL